MTDDGATPPQRSDDLSFEDAVEEGESARPADKTTTDKIARDNEARGKASRTGEPKPAD